MSFLQFLGIKPNIKGGNPLQKKINQRIDEYLFNIITFLNSKGILSNELSYDAVTKILTLSASKSAGSVGQKIYNTSADGLTAYYLYNHSNAIVGQLAFYNSSHATFPDQVHFGSLNGKSFYLDQGGVAKFYVDISGNCFFPGSGTLNIANLTTFTNTITIDGSKNIQDSTSNYNYWTLRNAGGNQIFGSQVGYFFVIDTDSNGTTNAVYICNRSTGSIVTYFYQNGDISHTGNHIISVAGKGIQIKEGTGGRQGVTSAMTGTPGSITVSNTTVTANTKVHYSRMIAGGALGHVSCTVSAGSGFTLTSTGNETSTFNYILTEPA